MEELCYSPLDIAAVIYSRGLGYRTMVDFLNSIWENEQSFFQKEYRDNKRKMILGVYYWLTYLSDNPAIDAEFPVIQMDMQTMGRELKENAYIADTFSLDLFFKSIRLRILYGGGKPYVRVKRKTLMAKYHYKRLSPTLVEHLHKCIHFYRLQPCVKDHVKCRIEDVGIDEMIVFRVI